MDAYIEKLRRIDARNPFSAYNEIMLESITSDEVVVRLNIRPESKNPYGMVHGGALYTMADNATGILACTNGRTYVTQSGSLHFLGNQPEGTIFAKAHMRHRGKTTALVAVDIVGDGDKLIATGEFTFFCVDSDKFKKAK